MRTTPQTFYKLDEEEIRNILLANLNCHFLGNATGETFRQNGKTDIRIEDEGRAAFIAECKIWGGVKAALDAIDQLLGYLTWRDCKTALILFNKSVAGFSSLQQKLPEALEKHDRFVRKREGQEPGEWRYTFKSKEDEDRLIQIHVFLANIFIDLDQS